MSEKVVQLKSLGSTVLLTETIVSKGTTCSALREGDEISSINDKHSFRMKIISKHESTNK